VDVGLSDEVSKSGFGFVNVACCEVEDDSCSVEGLCCFDTEA